MTDREAFLARWSRRKREAAAPESHPPAEERAAPVTESANPDAAGAAPVPETQPQPKPELPPIDAIDAGTDVRAFLQEGVPQDLARAALRRAWSSDPAIRDFIGLSENSWDFNAPEGVPGFGPFAPDAARKLVAQVLGDPHPEEGAEASVAAAAESQTSAGSAAAAADKIAQAQPPADANADAESQAGQEDIAVQQQDTGPEPPAGSSA
jgi:hypothetical protein